jgi:Cdc6-like AAA superfamily ATPase
MINERRAIDISRNTKGYIDEKVSLGIVNKAYQELFNSPCIITLQNASLYQKLFLAAIVKRNRITGLVEAEFESVYVEFSHLCEVVHEQSVDMDSMSMVCNQMGNYKWLAIEPNKASLKRRVRLNIPEEDIIAVLRMEVHGELNKLF